MEFIRRNSDYALRGLAYMAKFPLGQKFTIKAIAQKQDVPLSFLRKIFQKLSQANIVRSQPGVGGGFSLSRRPSQINLKEILESTQGPLALNSCLFEVNFCSRLHLCKVRKKLTDIEKSLMILLSQSTLKQIS